MLTDVRLALLAVIVSACVAQSHGGPVRDHVSFVDNLRAAGVAVEPVRQVTQPFLRGYGTALRLSGGNFRRAAELESYNYDDEDLEYRSSLPPGTVDGRRLADEDARRLQDSRAYVGPDPARFYFRGIVIVLYTGDDPELIALLDRLLGRPFYQT
jgi:hypothetical protein